MEDITKYIGLLGFVPFVVWVIVAKKYWNYEDRTEYMNELILAYIFWLIVFGLIWGITTLGRLL